MTDEQRARMGVAEDIPDRLDTKEEVEEYFEGAKERFDDHDVDIRFLEMEWNDMGSRAGKTEIRKDPHVKFVKKIHLHPAIVEKVPEHAPIVVIHELAHAVQIKEYPDRSKGHDHYWKRIMRDAGIRNPERTIKTQKNLADNYIIKCQSCGNEIGRKRKSKVIKHPENYRCDCGGKFQRIK